MCDDRNLVNGAGWDRVEDKVLLIKYKILSAWNCLQYSSSLKENIRSRNFIENQQFSILKTNFID